MNRLIIATGNTHKTEEIRKLLGSIFENIKIYNLTQKLAKLTKLVVLFKKMPN